MRNTPPLVLNSASTPRPVVIGSETIELSKLLKFAGLTGSGGEAKHAIREGHVLVNGIIETRKGKKLVTGDKITFAGETILLV